MYAYTLTMMKSDANEKLIEQLLENQPDAVLWFIPVPGDGNPGNNLTSDFAVQYYNRAAAHLYAISPSELNDKRLLLSTLMEEVPRKHFFEQCHQVWETGTKADYTYYSHVHDRYFNVQLSKVLDGILSITRDQTQKIKIDLEIGLEITEQKTLLDNILKHSANGISVTRVIRDAEGDLIDGQTILANDAAIQLTGIPREIYLSKRALELDPEITQTPYFQMLNKTLVTGDPQLAQYYFDSAERWLEITVSRLDHDHLITIFTDVTPAKEAQIRQQQLVEELKRSNQNLEEFVYSASHDLKEPIRKIYFFTEQLKERLNELLNKDHSRLLERVEKAAKRMGILVDDLLEYSHISKGMEKPEEIDLNNKLQVVLEELELTIHEKRAHIEVGILPTIKGHRRQIQQLFQNLIGNSLKYSKPGITPHISVMSRIVLGDEFRHRLPTIDPVQSFYLIEVADNGIGFEQKDAERIFNIFTRLHGNAEYSGNGVGLSIVRKVAENHGGYLWAESEPDKGSTFKVLLPAEVDK